MPRLRPRAVVFDADDTLWLTMPLYRKAILKFSRLMADHGFNPATAVSTLDHIDRANVASMGFTRRRFQVSMLATYAVLRPPASRASRTLQAQIRTVAGEVFETKAPVVKNAAKVLRSLKASFSLILLTKGEKSVQRKRLDESGLAKYFDAIRIVPGKTPMTFRDLRHLGVQPKVSWCVGDSLRSDIIPASRAGFEVIWITHRNWGYEMAPIPPKIKVRVCTNLEQVHRIILQGQTQ